MRADRLISLIMLLESRGPITAKELAAELEVSQRTIYRDIDALSAAGVPVYGEAGPDGGYQLIEGYRSYLDGLNSDEMLALLSLNIPEQFSKLDFGTKLKGAILKLRSSYNHLSDRDDKMAHRLYIDYREWDREDRGGEKRESSTHLNKLYRAISEERSVEIIYQHPIHAASDFVKTIDPYGLVTKENRWYLIYFYKEKIRVLDIFNITGIRELDDCFEYPGDFRLKEFWDDWCRQANQRLKSFRARVMVPESLKSSIEIYLKKGQVPFTPIPVDFDKQEWATVELYFPSFEEARSKLLSFGRAVKVVEPLSLKYSILDYAEQIQKLYE